MPRLAAPGLTADAIARVAAEVRLLLAPRLAVTAAVPFARLVDEVEIGGLTARARPHFGLPRSTYAVSEIDLAEGDAWIWLSRDAWPEFQRGDVPRTRATVAHELGHLALHASELADLEVDAEPDHDARLDREAWAFAAALLIPDQALRRLPRARPDEIARRFGVSVPMAQRRIEESERTA